MNVESIRGNSNQGEFCSSHLEVIPKIHEHWIIRSRVNCEVHGAELQSLAQD
jgi:hypothetical protein